MEFFYHLGLLVLANTKYGPNFETLLQHQLWDGRNCSGRQYSGPRSSLPRPDFFCDSPFWLQGRLSFLRRACYLHVVGYYINHFPLCIYPPSYHFVVSALPKDILSTVVLQKFINVTPVRCLNFLNTKLL